MSEFWFKSGKVVVDGSNKPLSCAGCACTGCKYCVNSGPDVDVSGQQVPLPSSWTVTLATASLTITYRLATTDWYGTVTIPTYGDCTVTLFVGTSGADLGFMILSIVRISDSAETKFRQCYPISVACPVPTQFSGNHTNVMTWLSGAASATASVSANYACALADQCWTTDCGNCDPTHPGSEKISRLFIAGFFPTVTPIGAGDGPACDACATLKLSGGFLMQSAGGGCTWNDFRIGPGTTASGVPYIMPPSPLACFGCVRYTLDYTSGKFNFKITPDPADGTNIWWQKTATDACNGVNFAVGDLIANTMPHYCDLTNVVVFASPIKDCAPPPTDCTKCPGGAPRVWKVPVAGVADGGGCTDCANANDTVLLYHTTECNWESDKYLLCGNVSTRTLRYSPGGDYWALQIGEELGTEYRIAGASFNCLGSNIMTKVADASLHCTNWPATVTMSPA